MPNLGAMNIQLVGMWIRGDGFYRNIMEHFWNEKMCILITTIELNYFIKELHNSIFHIFH